MISTSYSNQSLLTLYRGKNQSAAAAAAQTKASSQAIADLAKQARAAEATKPKSTMVVVPEGYVYETREELEARLAKAEAFMEKWEANEQAFEKQHGFRRVVNSMLQGAYDLAASGQGSGYGFKSHQEAQDYANGWVGGIWGMLVEANRATVDLKTPVYIEAYAAAAGITVDQMEAKQQDRKKANEMNMVIEKSLLDKSLQVSGGPIYGKQGDYYYMNNVEIRYEGKLVVKVEDNGAKVTLYDAAGTARDADPMHALDENKPGAYSRKETV